MKENTNTYFGPLVLYIHWTTCWEIWGRKSSGFVLFLKRQKSFKHSTETTTCPKTSIGNLQSWSSLRYLNVKVHFINSNFYDSKFKYVNWILKCHYSWIIIVIQSNYDFYFLIYWNIGNLALAGCQDSICLSHHSLNKAYVGERCIKINGMQFSLEAMEAIPIW